MKTFWEKGFYSSLFLFIKPESSFNWWEIKKIFVLNIFLDISEILSNKFVFKLFSKSNLLNSLKKDLLQTDEKSAGSDF